MRDEDTLLYHIEKGEFFEASEVAGSILEESPDELEYIANFFATKYWLNREKFFREEKKNYDFLLKEWKKFESVLTEKGYPTTKVINQIKRYLLLKVKSNLENRQHKEGIEEHDFPLLLEIAKGFLSVHDVSNTKEILQIAKLIQPFHPQIFFLYGDLNFMEMERTGNFEYFSYALSFFRDGFLLSPDTLDFKELQSETIKKIIRELQFLYDKNTEKVHYWLPVSIMMKALPYNIRKLELDEIFNIEDEVSRLEQELPYVNVKYREKTLSRLLFFYLVILHSLLHHYSDNDRVQEILSQIQEYFPQLYLELLKILDKIPSSDTI
ncbi:MAG: hypothetical protein NZ853_08455 [Leptospiraceae bacterium]|nr:hypothetical protein [Leptospiraceae bacterium]MDW7976793.1 hypothetical protein [Leptospiraceae bacterium]